MVHLVFILMLSKIYVARAHVLTRRGECRERWAPASEAPLGRVQSSLPSPLNSSGRGLGGGRGAPSFVTRFRFRRTNTSVPELHELPPWSRDGTEPSAHRGDWGRVRGRQRAGGQGQRPGEPPTVSLQRRGLGVSSSRPLGARLRLSASLPGTSGAQRPRPVPSPLSGATTY